MLLLVATAALGAPLRLSATLGDHMVLARDAVAPPAMLWGFAAAGVAVTVTMDKTVQLPTVTTGADGIFRIALPPTPAGGPHAFTLNASDGYLATLSDVLFGEVVLCSGQSNMQSTVCSRRAPGPIVCDIELPIIHLR